MDEMTMQRIRESLLDRWRAIEEATTVKQLDKADEPLSQAEVIDMAQSLEQIGRDASLAAVERREKAAIERALAKLSTGGFGMCEDCAEEIPAKRLIALPSARLCAQCQTFEERQAQKTRRLRAA